MSSNEETPTTSAATSITPAAAVVSALPITVQAASHNSPAFVNLSVGELLQKQRRITVVTVPASRSVASPPVGLGNRFPIKPMPRQSFTDNIMSRSSSYPSDHNKLNEAAAETSQLNIIRKSNVDLIKTEVAAEQAHRLATPVSTSILGSTQLDDLIRQIDPTSILDDPVKIMLTEFVEDFVDQVIDRSCKLARHRGSVVLESKDVEFVLRRYFNCPTLPKYEPQAKSDSTENIQKISK
ncbi:hypothetical protein DINM_002074 [Dirofilaria immitis]|nr:hypothetical protein [Dirofilaria immitis]